MKISQETISRLFKPVPHETKSIIHPNEQEQFEQNHKSDLNRILISLKKHKVDTVCIETGHIYIDETTDQKHAQEMIQAKHLIEFLKKHGIKVITVLFIDNYNPNQAHPKFSLASHLCLR